jgi:hypothetical protein
MALTAILVGSGCSANVGSPPVTQPPPKTGNKGTIYSAATLEKWYEASFCQLSTPGTSWQSQQCQQDVTFIASQPDTGNFNLNEKPILHNPVGVLGATFQPIDYQTTVSLPGGSQTFNVSGALAMPLGINKSKLKGVVVCFHGTQFDNSSVPSNLSPETKLETALFTSQGYIVVSPDYIGQGVDYANVHPYVLYPRASAQTAVDLLSAVLPLIVARYGLSSSDTLKLFSSGFSEGGAYSLWFNTYLNDNPGLLNSAFVLTHSVGDEGAYNLSKVTSGFLFSDVKLSDNRYHIQNQAITNVAKPVLGADVLLSFSTYSFGSKYLLVFNRGFYALRCTFPKNQSKCDINGQRLNMAQALTLPSTDPSLAILNSAEKKRTGPYKYPGGTKILTSEVNNATALVATVKVPTNPILRSAERAANVNLIREGKGAVSIISLDDDSVVTPNNFDALLLAFRAKLKFAVKLDQTKLWVASVSPLSHKTVYNPPDHPTAMVYELPYDLGIFNSFQNPAR